MKNWLIYRCTSPLPEFSELETRQEKILSQLAELKKQVSMLRNCLKHSNPNAITKLQNENCENEATKDCVLQKTVNINLIVNVDPSRPPYSIYALQKLWKDTDIRVTTYIHSTVAGAAPVIFHNIVHPTSNNIVNLSLIYKKVDDLEIVTGLPDHAILGEVNFLRYLSRLIDTHNYEKNDVAFVNAVDNILDLCCRIYHQVSRDKTDETLSALQNAVKQTRWTGKSEPSIADIAAWSTIKQLPKRNRPQFLHEWYERCEKTFMNSTLAL